MGVIKNSQLELPNSVTKNYLVIGNNNINYGPTSSSGYYADIDVPENGYVFYRATSGGKLNGFIANNNSELISIVNRLSNNAGITTVQDALTWLASNSEYFIKNRPIPNIWTENLSIYHDIGLLDCYPGFGNSVESFSKYTSTNITLYNSPQYTSNFGGVLSFDDTLSQYGQMPSPGGLSTFTIEVWFKLNTTLNNKTTSILSNQYILSGGVTNVSNYSIGTLNAPNDYNLRFGFCNGTWRMTPGFVPNIDTWYHVVGTYDGTELKQYVNGELINSYVDPGIGTGGISSFNVVMKDFRYNSAPNNYTNGELAISRIYSTPLTDAQVLQNYNAEKDRFITPTTPFLYFDPSDVLSYPGSGNTINDLSGNNLNGTLSNISFTSPYFSYNGTSQVTIADNSLLEPGSGDLTMEVWVNQSSPGTEVVLGKFDNGGLASDVAYSIRTNGSTYYAQIGSGSGSGTSLYIDSIGYPGTLNTWYHIVYVFKNGATKTLEAFVNGVSVGSVSHNLPSILNTANPLYLGSYNGGEYSQPFQGKIGITRLYNVALSPAEISLRFNNDKSKYGL